MGLRYKAYFPNGVRIYACAACKTHLALKDCVMSTAFHGQHGKAYLFKAVVNVREGEPEERPMTTGLHVVRDIVCVQCGVVLGWRYVRAYQEDQRYKEGRYILEKELLVSAQA